jgi:hypothetical protein
MGRRVVVRGQGVNYSWLRFRDVSSWCTFILCNQSRNERSEQPRFAEAGGPCVRECRCQNGRVRFNGLWQAKVWARFHYDSLTGVQAQSARYVAAHRQRAAARIEAAAGRRPFPRFWQLDLQAHPQGRLIFIRRSNAQGEVQLLGRTFAVEPLWQHRLVRAEVDLTKQRIRFCTLRRRAPDQQPLVKETKYVLPRRKFTE